MIKHVNTWDSYKLDTPLFSASDAELRQAVRKAAKAANQRLVRLEKSGFTSGLYKHTMADLQRSDRRRFKERPTNMTTAELRTEYQRLRDFLSAKTSTVQGRKGVDYMRYQTAVEKGFKGTQEEFYDAIEKYFSGTAEQFYSSDVVYDSIISDDTDDIDGIIAIANERKDAKKGDVLLSLLRKKSTRKKSTRKKR